ncbi:MAG: hypothetical protein RIC37_01200 [Gammaproteobacteria bacterium]
MISPDNKAVNQTSADQDFTIGHYRKLLKLAKDAYEIARYTDIPWGSRFLLWRHDLDFSVNRALVLANVEHQENIKSTYFINPHSEFYNIAEAGQHKIIQKILFLGHDLGLHFDAAFYNILNEQEINILVEKEAEYLHALFGVKPVAFSFHNPVEANFTCEADHYGGLVNCYSKKFKVEVPYCSDSNGYWRFQRLYNVLYAANEPCLQVLTHPGWWQDEPIPPRQRIFRSVYGRAAATMRIYDSGIKAHGRLNHAGRAASLRFLEYIYPSLFKLYDYLWNTCQLETLYLELWRLHERQINNLCKAVIRKEWSVPVSDINSFFEDSASVIDGRYLFIGVFGQNWQSAACIDEEAYNQWGILHKKLVHGHSTTPNQVLVDGCMFFCHALEALVAWGNSQPIGYDGISSLESIGIPTCKTEDDSIIDLIEDVGNEVRDLPNKRWEQFKIDMQKIGAGVMAE